MQKPTECPGRSFNAWRAIDSFFDGAMRHRQRNELQAARKPLGCERLAELLAELLASTPPSEYFDGVRIPENGDRPGAATESACQRLGHDLAHIA
jgi:hypothetical protein